MPYIWQHDSWPEFEWQDDRLIHAIGQARLAQGKLLSKVQALGVELSKEAQAEILTEEAINTAAIEGENLDKFCSLVSGKTSWPAHRRVASHCQAYRWIGGSIAGCHCPLR